MDIGWKLENSYSELPKTFYSEVQVSPVREPSLVVLNEALAGELGLSAQALKSEDGVAVLAGNRVPSGFVRTGHW